MKRIITASFFPLLAATYIVITPIASANDPSLAMAAGDYDNPNTDSLSVEILADHYRERAARLELEIHNESERRTAIGLQIDKISDEISTLEDTHQHSQEPVPLIDSQQAIRDEIAALESDIQNTSVLLEQLQHSIASQPDLSVWKAALGSPEIQARRQLLATRSYLLHSTQKQQQQLQKKQAMLDKQNQSLNEYKNNIKQSIGEMKGHFNTLVERRTHLEQQLTAISSQIATRQDRLASLSKRSKQASTNPASLYFGSLEKKLADPVEGQVIREFSEPKAKGLLRWKGILVEAPLGLPFTSVADGLVVFADELQGLGKVAIVDHGHGYMTLYGMAELLLVEKSQLLLAGDPVGTIGESFGADTSALYFEVRHNADALNPKNWLQMHRISEKNTR